MVRRKKLSEEERRARRRIRLVTPENSQKVLSNDIFWTVPFLRLFLEMCDQVAFEDPQAAHAMAVHAPHLAMLVRVGASTAEYPDSYTKRSFRVLALGVFGSTCMRLDKAREAARQYRQAFDLYKQGVSDEAKADLHRRYGKMRSVLREPDAADHFEMALELFRKNGDPAGESQALVLRAGLYWYQSDRRRATLDLAAALEAAAKTPKDPRAKRSMTAALGNLARIVSEDETGMLEASDALHLVKLARRELVGTAQSSLKMNLCWVEALLCRKLHFIPLAVRLFVTARTGFARLKMPGRFLLVSIDLGITLLEQGDSEAFEEIQAETRATLRTLSDDPQVFELLESWVGDHDSSQQTKQAVAAVFRTA